MDERNKRNSRKSLDTLLRPVVEGTRYLQNNPVALKTSMYISLVGGFVGISVGINQEKPTLYIAGGLVAIVGGYLQGVYRSVNKRSEHSTIDDK